MDKINILGYCLSVTNIGIIVQNGNRLIAHSFWQTHKRLYLVYNAVFWFLLKCQFYYIEIKSEASKNGLHYLSYIYFRGKCIQLCLLSLIIGAVMITDTILGYDFDFECLFDICTDHYIRIQMINSKHYYFGIILLILGCCSSIFYLILVRFYLHKYMTLGFVLSRNPWVLIKNGKWNAGLRALRALKSVKTESVDMMAILKYCIDNRVAFPVIPYNKHVVGMKLDKEDDCVSIGIKSMIPEEETTFTADKKKDAFAIVAEVNKYSKLSRDSKILEISECDQQHGMSTRNTCFSLNCV